MENIVRLFGDLAQALGAEFRNNSADARDFFECFCDALRIWSGCVPTFFFRAANARRTLVIVGEIGDVLEQDEFQCIGGLRWLWATVELLQILDQREEWIWLSHGVG